MKLDEKYFVPFLVIVAIMAAIIIVFFTIHNQSGKERNFKKAMAAQDSLRYQYMPVLDSSDSLSVQSFPKSYVIVDFWATWTPSFSEQAHKQLNKLKEIYGGRLQILAAVVQDKPKNVEEYINRYDYPFHYVNGTKVFNNFHVPGVPTQLVYVPGGKLTSIFSGSADSKRMDSLKTLIGDGS